MAKNCYVDENYGKVLRLVNTSGADLVANEFTIIGGFGAVATEAIASTAAGSFNIGGRLHTSSLTTGADTFGTANALVYFNNTANTFGDTTGTGLYVVGQVAEVKASGIVGIALFERATVV